MVEIDTNNIFRLSGWESLDMVVIYTRSVKFEGILDLCFELDSIILFGVGMRLLH
jgi:hypothetical protein